MTEQVSQWLSMTPKMELKESGSWNLQAKPSEASKTKFSFPTIDLNGIDKYPILHKEIVEKDRGASESLGLLVSGESGLFLEEMMDGDDEVSKLWYTRDNTKRLFCNSNFDLCGASAANCRDSFYSVMPPEHPIPVELPTACCLTYGRTI
ncbi:hypothetical protein RJ640_010522 [Escallonia rubra]|uniref:Uncharacterized protein n=1 Tax=Escallonia rubra TaxID=112253 RepID=A0AA88QEV3_9ASTE|nr:hypothetical protein RJ640_010522 [Escallonia rubra]